MGLKNNVSVLIFFYFTSGLLIFNKFHLICRFAYIAVFQALVTNGNDDVQKKLTYFLEGRNKGLSTQKSSYVCLFVLNCDSA